jgi:hypothetical protein
MKLKKKIPIKKGKQTKQNRLTYQIDHETEIIIKRVNRNKS